MTGTPTQLLERLVREPVLVELKDDRTVAGRLLGADEHMNLVLEDAQERTGESSRRLGRVVVRGSNVVSLSTAPAGGR